MYIFFLKQLRTYFHLMNIRSTGGGTPSLQGIDIGPPYRAVTLSVAQTVTQKGSRLLLPSLIQTKEQPTTRLS